MPEITDAIVLCGGAGIRLRSVIGEAPKGMAEVGGRPFLELLLRQIHRHGFQRCILAVGYQREAVRAYFGEHACGLDLVYSEEARPLGTGGALRNAAGLIARDTVLVMNGDSYTDVDLGEFLEDYRQAKADASVVVVPADGRQDCGFVLIDEGGKVASFDEKQVPLHARDINAGIYLFSRPILGQLATEGEVSLEREVLPRWIQEGRYIRAFRSAGMCVDIGTPERFRSAQSVLTKVEA
jgi:NDP-sugar pyrophosphorylase family protein